MFKSKNLPHWQAILLGVRVECLVCRTPIRRHAFMRQYQLLTVTACVLWQPALRCNTDTYYTLECQPDAGTGQFTSHYHMCTIYFKYYSHRP